MGKADITRIDINSQFCRFGESRPIKELGEGAVSAV
jgi:hypothetical protein